MPVRPVCRYPESVLTRKAETVKRVDETVRKEVQDLLDTMYASPATIGLAAPQIGIAKRIFVTDLSSKDPKKKRRVFINPEIIQSSGSRICREGCLSLPDYTGNVSRFEHITVRGLDENGTTVVFSTDGMEAICWQHELDHLNGLLFIHRVTNIKTDVFRRKRYKK